MAYLLRRGGTYHFRCRVPDELVETLGRRELRRSLATVDHRQAKRRAARAYAAVQAIFDGLKRSSMGDSEPSRDQVIELLTRQLDEAVAFIRESAAAQVRDLIVQAKASEERATFYDRATNALDTLLGEYELSEKAGKIDRAKETVAQIRGLLGDIGVAAKSTPAPTVTEFLTGTYIEEKRLRDDSQRHVTNYVTLFAKITGDKPMNEYTRKDVLVWIRTLERLKSSLGKSAKDEHKTIKQLTSESRGKPTMGETTIGKHVTHVKGCFKAAIKYYKFGADADIDRMFDDIPLSDGVPRARKRKIWTIEQLNALFASPIWAGTRSRPRDFSKRHEPGPHIYRDAYWWLPVLALWTGARLEELAQLHHDDLGRDKNGIAFIRIHDEGARRVKNENSIRDVPVHPLLESIGFLKLFRPSAPGAKSRRIFPELKPSGRLEKLGDTYSGHFTEYRRACDLYEPLRDFHSLRRTFITTLRTKAKPPVDPLTVAALAGHDDELPEFQRVKQTEDYTDYDLESLKAAIEKLDYVALGLDVKNLVCKP